MHRLKVAAISLLTLCGLGISVFAGLLYFSPGIILSPFADSALADSGYELTGLEVSGFNSESAVIESANLSGESLSFSVKNVELEYTLSSLLLGQMESVHIGELKLVLFDETTSTGASEPPPSVTDLLEAVDQIPVERISIDNVEVINPDERLQLEFGMRTKPLILNGELNFNANQQIKIAFNAGRVESDSIELFTDLFVDEVLVANSESSMKIAEDNKLDITASHRIHLEEILSLDAMPKLPEKTALLTETLSLQSDFTLVDVFTQAEIQNLHITVDSPSSLIHIGQQSDLGETDMQIRLPISIDADALSLNSQLELFVSDIYATGSWLNESTEFHAQNSFSAIELSCASLGNCNLSTSWQYDSPSWRLATSSGDNLSATARLNFNFSNNELRVSSPSIDVSIPTVENEVARGSARFSFEEMEIKVGESLSGSFNFLSTELSPQLEKLVLQQPQISGRVIFEDEVLTLIAELDLKQQLRMGIALQHYFFRDYGDAEIQLAPYTFSSLTPLSAVIDQSIFNVDFVAGEVQGLANVSWSKQADQSWEFGGPVVLQIENLSGIVNEFFFVGLTTDLFAEATTPLGLRTNQLHSANLSNIDIGLPLENLTWQYSFDSEQQQFLLQDLDLEVLGGNVAIPQLDFDGGRAENKLDVVISNLNLDTIVNLAEYPGLQVDGLISGYIPLLIRDSVVTIDQGLVGALNPGGSIRYTPESTVPNSNPSIQLVNDALSNYQYQTMNTEIFYDDAGDLRMEVQLQGRNPDLNDGQAINLNVNITDNIPTLLRSLQASRIITDELEQALQK